MPSPRRNFREPLENVVRVAAVLVGVFLCALFCASPAIAQITSVTNFDGRRLFVNAEPPNLVKGIVQPKTPSNIYLGGEISLMGRERPAMNIDRDGAEKLVQEAADRHHVDPALVRAVIETESNWNPAARSRKGAQGLMQLIPTTAMRFGVNDAFNPRQNVEAGVRYLRTLLERYNGNLDLALAAYNAGEGAVDRAHGVPSYRETRDYVQKVQNAYFRSGSGRQENAFLRPNAIHRDINSSGRVVFTNE